MSKKICAVVVTYNRKFLLANNISSLLNQSNNIDSIIIVDNHSKDNTYEYILDKFGTNSHIDYIYLNDNIGGAGGFECGVKRAYEKDFDYIWLMDDDGHPRNNDTLRELVKIIKVKQLEGKPFILNSLVLFDDNTLSFYLFDNLKSKDRVLCYEKGGIIENEINPFNGTLISKELVKKIGFPNGDFFIKGDEYDYTMRAKSAGAFIATVVNSLYFHPVLSRNYTKILWRKAVSVQEAPWKEYYRIRNTTYMYYKCGKKMLSFNALIKKIIVLIFSNRKDKFRCMSMICKGYKDGVRGILGPTVKP